MKLQKFVLVACCMLLASVAHAEMQVPNCSPLSLNEARLEAKKLLDTAEQARDLRAKVGALEAAYRLYQDPLILYNLGLLWLRAGKRSDGADLLRRYLYEASSSVSEARRDRIARLLLTVRGAGELNLLSEPCAFVYVDRRLVGRAPLSLPLWLKPGAHLIEVEKDHRKRAESVTVGPGQSTLTVRLPGTVVAVSRGQLMTQAALSRALQRAVAAHESLTLITDRAREAILQRTPQLRGCIEQIDCQEELARQLKAQYVLLLSTEALPSPRLVVRLLDVDIGTQSVRKEAAWAAPGEEARAEQLALVLGEVLRLGLSMPKGTLEITAVPQADVILDGRKVGRTPFLRSALAGAHQVLLSADGHLPHQVHVDVLDGRKAAIFAKLKAEVAPLQAPPLAQRTETRPAGPVVAFVPAAGLGVERGAGRPRWRIIAGSIAMGLGVGLVALGGAALSIDGRCSIGTAEPDMGLCRQVYQSLGPGAAMLASGAALALGGALTIAWPEPGARARRLACRQRGGGDAN